MSHHGPNSPMSWSHAEGLSAPCWHRSRRNWAATTSGSISNRNCSGRRSTWCAMSSGRTPHCSCSRICIGGIPKASRCSDDWVPPRGCDCSPSAPTAPNGSIVATPWRNCSSNWSGISRCSTSRCSGSPRRKWPNSLPAPTGGRSRCGWSTSSTSAPVATPSSSRSWSRLPANCRQRSYLMCSFHGI